MYFVQFLDRHPDDDSAKVLKTVQFVGAYFANRYANEVIDAWNADKPHPDEPEEALGVMVVFEPGVDDFLGGRKRPSKRTAGYTPRSLYQFKNRD